MRITVRLDKRYRLANGKYPVKLAIARNGKTLYVPVGVDVAEEDWDADARNQNYVRNVRERNALNQHIRARLALAEQAVRDLQARGLLRQYDNKTLVEYLSADRTASAEERQLFRWQAQRCIADKKPSTAETYRNAIKAFSRHYDYETFPLSGFTKRMLEELRDKLHKDELKPNTVTNYLLKIKAVYKFAYDNGDTDTPFPHIGLRREQTRRRALLVEQIRQLINADVSRAQRKYIDVFTLMLYMRGINMGDLSELLVSDIVANRIEYRRDKTGKHLEIKLEPEMLEIINRYKGRKALLRFFDNKPRGYHKRFGNAMRQTLRLAASRIGITEPVSSNWARHTWSSLAIEIGVDIAYVSAGLSHSHGAPITQTYIQYRQKKIDEESRRVMDYVLQKGEFAKQ